MSPLESGILNITIIHEYKTFQVSKKFCISPKSVLWRGTSLPKLTFIVVLVINKLSHWPGMWDREKHTTVKQMYLKNSPKTIYVVQHHHGLLKYWEMATLLSHVTTVRMVATKKESWWQQMIRDNPKDFQMHTANNGGGSLWTVDLT